MLYRRDMSTLETRFYLIERPRGIWEKECLLLPSDLSSTYQMSDGAGLVHSVPDGFPMEPVGSQLGALDALVQCGVDGLGPW